METFDVKILEMRRRIGIKRITAPSIEIAVASITQLLKDYMLYDSIPEKVINYFSTPSERKFKLIIGHCIFSVSISLSMK